MSSPVTRDAAARLREIDDFLAAGGLEHSRHRRKGSRLGPSPENSSKSLEIPKIIRKAPTVLRVPEWQQYSWLVHGFSTRPGGVSTAYRAADLNLGFTPADSEENVLSNRERFRNKVTARSDSPMQMVLLRQVHGGIVHRIEASTAALPLMGDGMIAAEPDWLLAIQTADCIPVLVVDVRQRVVAAFHAGWRGTVARIVERGVGRMRAECGSRSEDLRAAIGPGIGRCCYAVGEEVRIEFGSQFSYAGELFEEVFDLDPIKQKYPMLFLTARAPGHSNLGPSMHLDLPEANRRQLLDGGIAAERIHNLACCTACDTDRFFSYRAEQGSTGRMLSVIGVAR